MGEIAAVADHEPVISKTFTVPDYGEVKLRLSIFNEKLHRSMALSLFYESAKAMRTSANWEAGRWTMLEGSIAVARLDFIAGTTVRSHCAPGSPNIATSKRSISDGLMNVTAIDNDQGENGSLIATSVSNGDQMKLNCTWSGSNLGYVTAMESPLHVLAGEPLRNPDPQRIAPRVQRLIVRPWDVTFIFSVFDPTKPIPRNWTYFWIIKAIGQLPRMYADKTPWDFREINATIILNDIPVGMVQILKGQL